MTSRTISLTGARGGHGTTTIAAALALFAADHQRTALVSSDPSTAALIGVASSGDDTITQVTPTLALARESSSIAALAAEVVVIDASAATSGPQSDIHAEHYVVLRGPCYVALASLLAHPERPDAIILVAEPKRSLTARDVTDVLDVPVVATVEASPDVARTIDAGLLVSRLHRLRELAPLRALATDPYAGRVRPSTARSRQRRTPLSNSIQTCRSRKAQTAASFVARVNADTAGLLSRR